MFLRLKKSLSLRSGRKTKTRLSHALKAVTQVKQIRIGMIVGCTLVSQTCKAGWLAKNNIKMIQFLKKT